MKTQGPDAYPPIAGTQPAPGLDRCPNQPPDFIFAFAASQSALDISLNPWPLQLF
jgi:hypothetical protein